MNNIKITPLGTVSPYCYNNHTCPGFLITYKDYKLLLDCGNGIINNLDIPNDLKNLYVFITHLHFDHYGDLGSLEYTAFTNHNLGLIDEKINIYLPEEDLTGSLNDLKYGTFNYANINYLTDNLILKIADLDITFHNNQSHTKECYMIKLENKDFKIVYTSDVGSTNLEDLIDFSLNADILICESSLLKEHNIDSKVHLTALDAAEIAKDANVSKLLLTHLWPQEERLKYLNEARTSFKNSFLAEERNSITLTRKYK